MITVRIDNKHSIVVPDSFGAALFGTPVIAKRTVDGAFIPIPADEPVILFRARDKLALRMLYFYRELCSADGCTDFQLGLMDDMIGRFKAFAEKSETMKQPGSTLGR